MEYCARCCYPANARPTIIFDDEGVCSGCRYHESRQNVNWGDRERLLRAVLEEQKARAREAGNPYDCIIPVSGGKDSHYQAYLMKHVYGMNPLLVTFNHSYNTRLGNENLRNIVKKFGMDLVRFTASPEAARKISRYMLKRVGDMTWHYHAGIRTFPFQIAVKYKIPLVILGEHGFAELTGLVSIDDLVEHTKWSRQEHDMRGIEPNQLINEESGITRHDLSPYVYPPDEEIEKVGVRGLYMSNFFYWDALPQAKKMHEEFGFNLHPGMRERTFILHGKIEDHANDVHDYLKYLKFGYGRATDDASMEIRHGRMTREEGIELVKKYDAARPSSLDIYLDFMGITEEEFYSCLDGMRDEEIWRRTSKGKWVVTDSIAKHVNDFGVNEARVPLVAKADRTFGKNNRKYYWRDDLADAAAKKMARQEKKAARRIIVL
ncbi:MAG: N-acetyl sugar amidotransferase [Proteobacteria bacterium]|nr:N-acetyl sugar amidotransferase [Pseudomonadota bacterium]MBU1687940.1 N-acetyl sugar amidotransferase [Pseudomonadota bacterium]